jgi:hypothetical protein
MFGKRKRDPVIIWRLLIFIIITISNLFDSYTPMKGGEAMTINSIPKKHWVKKEEANATDVIIFFILMGLALITAGLYS